MSASRKQEILDGVDEYLKLHAQDPEAYPRTVVGYRDFIGCSRSLFYKDDAEIAAAVARLTGEDDRTDVGSGPDLALTSEDDGASVLSDKALESEIRRTIARARWPMQRFVDAQGRADSIGEVAHLGLADLEKVIGTLVSVRKDLAPLVEDLQRRQRERVGSSESQEEEFDLFSHD